MAHAGGAGAQPESAVEVHLKRGIELRKEGRDAEALEQFRDAYQFDQGPRVRAQIALAEQALGYWVEAERELTLVLATAGDPWIEGRRKSLEVALGRVKSHLGSLVVQSNVAGAVLFVDGEEVSTLPAPEPVRLVVGSHALRITAEGYSAVQRSVEVAANGRVHEIVVLIPLDKRLDATESDGVKSQPPLSTTSWISLGVCSGLLVAGATALAVREINVARYNDGSRCVFGTLSREERCGSYRDWANVAEITAIGAFSGAGLAAFIAGFSWANDFMKARRAALSIGCTTSGCDATYQGTF